MNLLLSKKLRYFMVAMETRCINTAAEELCITRSPLAKLIYELESRLDSKLFTRRYNILEPTPFAIKFYERIKPTYDLLSSMEKEYLNKGCPPSIEILFGAGIPHCLYQHYIQQLKELNIAFTHRQIIITPEELSSVAQKTETILFSYKEYHCPQNVKMKSIKDECLYILASTSISDSDLQNRCRMKDIPLYISARDHSSKMKGILSFLISESFPSISIKESSQDYSSALYAVATGKAMLFMSEEMTKCFQLPQTRKIKVPDITLQHRLYINKEIKNIASLKMIEKILTTSIY
ncbi:MULTISPECIES: LysR family transcriptional regulator [Enterobacterales]|uniref:LysR family transcriptional regulator n=1 Tax=Enterobacterales TaxID=91347 RepID=UPI002ED8D58E